MNLVLPTIGLLCMITIIVTAQSCDDQQCTNFCNPNNCSKFECNGTKDCAMGCFGRKCDDMICYASTKSCFQLCGNCLRKSKMVCSSDYCEQSCDADFCDMTCDENVKTCSQICSANSTCKVSCNVATTNCQLSCDGNCTGLPEKPKQPKTNIPCDGQSCTVLPEKPKTQLPEKPKTQLPEKSCNGKNCNKTCKGNCALTTLVCDALACHLSCENGCTMKCGNKVKTCVQKCIGDVPCNMLCDAADCQRIEKQPSRSSALSYQLIILYLPCLLISFS